MLKHVILGNARFLLRGLQGAQIETTLATMAYNLKPCSTRSAEPSWSPHSDSKSARLPQPRTRIYPEKKGYPEKSRYRCSIPSSELRFVTATEMRGFP